MPSIFVNSTYKLLIGVALISALENSCISQVTIVLCDMTKIDTPAVNITPNFIEIKNGQTLRWDRVLSVSGLKSEQDTKFNSYLNEIGLPLFRIKHRLKNGNLKSLSEITDPLVINLSQQKIELDVQANYLISLAKCRESISQHRRVNALNWFIKMCRLKKNSATEITKIGNCDFSDSELALFFTEAILPIWFDKSSVTQVVDQLNVDFGKLKDLPDGLLIYMASLYSTLEQLDKAKIIFAELSNRKSDLVKLWLPIIKAQSSLYSNGPMSELTKSYQTLTGTTRAVANFLVASRNTVNPDDYDIAVLNLLYIPANFSKKYPTLAAAALKLAADISEKSGKLKEAKMIRSDLRSNYKNTFHGIESTNQ